MAKDSNYLVFCTLDDLKPLLFGYVQLENYKPKKNSAIDREIGGYILTDERLNDWAILAQNQVYQDISHFYVSPLQLKDKEYCKKHNLDPASIQDWAKYPSDDEYWASRAITTFKTLTRDGIVYAVLKNLQAISGSREIENIAEYRWGEYHRTLETLIRRSEDSIQVYPTFKELELSSLLDSAREIKGARILTRKGQGKRYRTARDSIPDLSRSRFNLY